MPILHEGSKYEYLPAIKLLMDLGPSLFFIQHNDKLTNNL